MIECSFGFEKLEVWKKAREFKQEIRKVVKSFPANEKFYLSDQLTRSVRSVLAQIAEGHGRFTYPEQIHYCIQARGSLTETVNHLIEACDEGYISSDTLYTLKLKAKEIELLLNGYINYLRKQKQSK